jgi:protein phosphatase
MTIDLFGLTYIGKKRKRNEDSYLCLTIANSEQQESPPYYLLAVADGIGGQAAGGVASSMAMSCLKEEVPFRLSKKNATLTDKDILEQSFLEANHRIYRRASANADLTGMGTTLVAAVIRENQATISNVGDSRAYFIHDGVIDQVSRDHSWIAEQVRSNILSERDVRNSPFRNLVTRSLGLEPGLEVDSYQVLLKAGNYLLLCTDGLYGALSDEDILQVFMKDKEPERICRQLITQADHRGGRDNIAVVVAMLQESAGDGLNHLSERKGSDGTGSSSPGQGEA